MKRWTSALLLTAMVLTSCGRSAQVGTSESVQAAGGAATPPAVVAQPVEATRQLLAEEQPQPVLQGELNAEIALAGDEILVQGSGVTVDGTRATITAPGTYRVHGALSDGQLVVDTSSDGAVVLVLEGVNITNSSGAPILVSNADEVTLVLAEGSENVVTDGEEYRGLDENGEPDAAIFSKDDLTITGAGSLEINARYRNGIASKDDLNILGGTILVSAANDGVKGKDSITVNGAHLTISAGADGMESTNADEDDKGYIVIEDAELHIMAALDGVHAATDLRIAASTAVITTGGGSVDTSVAVANTRGGPGMEGNPYKPADSAKALKADRDLVVAGGRYEIDAADDAIHANRNLTIESGGFVLASGDDAMHADDTVTIQDGVITVSRAYEGIEGANTVIDGGLIHLSVSDDGVNGAGGTDGSAINARPGWDRFAETGDHHLQINGGYLYVDTLTGDGLDINGPIDMTGGTVIVNGPTTNFNGALDYTGHFNITGGFLLAVGSSGMAQAPSTTSTQYAFMHNFDAMQPEGTLLHIETDRGEGVITFMPTKAYQSVLLSSPDLRQGQTYVIYTGGAADGSGQDGLYTEAAYTPGAEAARIELSDVVVVSGAVSRFPGGPRGFMGGMPPAAVSDDQLVEVQASDAGDGWRVPSTAVMQRGPFATVWAMRDGQLTRIEVTVIGEPLGDEVVIQSDQLRPGDRVVRDVGAIFPGAPGGPPPASPNAP